MMTTHTVPFKQVDVFTAVPFKGNPLAVVFDAEGLDTAQMQAIAHWTNLSETTFLVTPTDPSADYHVRIFTTHFELPFAGHPTLGTAHALLESGYRPKQPGKLIQQCGVGLVELVEQTDGNWAFAAPPAPIVPLPQSEYDTLHAALRGATIDFSAPPCAVNNGVPWLVVRVNSAQECLAIKADTAALARVAESVKTLGIAVYGPHETGDPATFELRCLMSGASFSVGEDPVTGSANAALATLLLKQQKRPGVRYTVRQGTALGRAGDVVVRYDDAADKIWIGGPAVTIVDGTIDLPHATAR
ncbi:phenazine biosynthesis protein PhzF family [Paraburkholderia megapolitana]|uniref:Phenazine biosynthesis protein PhzF family n=2 Tax=Paraburkholderia megapolitana TaxID=420953 RepID=A0A1I3TWG6_9BURK|nr:phenazine biosynthesis protein PhzF family [Paraburkholderia megapolitana]